MTTYSAGDLTKKKIIDAAGELAGELGLAHVTTRAVAERSEENIGSIHYHFGGKDGLLKAVLREAIGCCLSKEYEDRINEMTEACSPEEFSRTVRLIIQTEITDLFRSNRPAWHAQLMYQVLQRSDELYDLMAAEMMDPNLAALNRFFRLVKPALSDEETMIHIVAMLMPVFSHATYMKALHRMLNVSAYSETYLQKLEDVLVRQTRLLLDLPDDV
jgi:AcrR family transcriptional regulator